jgi:hypothetical protein
MEKLTYKRIGRWVFMAILSITILSCETINGTFEDFTKDGEVIYVGTPDTVLVGSGFNKLRFWIAMNADPKITKGRLSTIDQSITHEFDLVRTQNGKDTISFDLNIPEGEYTFGVLLMDAIGNSSVRKEISAKVYGESYQSGLVNRGLTQIETFVQGAAFHWADTSVNMITTTLSYEDKNGVMQTIEVSNGETRTLVDSYKLGGRVMINSSFKPSPISIEDFNAIPSERTFPDDYILEKSHISALRLPGDASDGCHGSTYERLTDGSIAEYWHSCDTAEDQYPFIMSFDLGTEANLSRFKLDERQDCCGERSPASYQIWGSNDLNQVETIDIDKAGIESWEADAQTKGWVKLVDQSGNLNGTFTVEIPASNKNYRYLRFVGISAIDGSSITGFNELTFWAK